MSVNVGGLCGVLVSLTSFIQNSRGYGTSIDGSFIEIHDKIKCNNALNKSMLHLVIYLKGESDGSQ